MPNPVAQTDRLIVRWFARDDDEALFEAIDRSRHTLLPFLPWALTSHENRLQSRDFIDSCTRDRSLVEADNFALGLFERETGACIGGTGFHRIAAESATAEIGYWVDAMHRRKGFCAEAAGALITAGFRDWGFRRIKVCCASVNAGSIAVVDRLHLRLEAVERGERWLEGFGWTDQLTYAVLEHEWDPATGRGSGGTSLDASVTRTRPE